ARRRVAVAGPSLDLGIASYCLNPTRPGHDAFALAHELLGEPGERDADPVVAACRTARIAHALRPRVLERLTQVDMQRLFQELELPLLEVLAEMELAGIALDVPALQAMSRELAEALETLVAEIYGLAGGPFNIGSPVQLREVLFERLKLPTKGVRK